MNGNVATLALVLSVASIMFSGLIVWTLSDEPDNCEELLRERNRLLASMKAITRNTSAVRMLEIAHDALKEATE